MDMPKPPWPLRILLIVANLLTWAVCLALWKFFMFAGIEFSLGVTAGSLLWHLMYSWEKGSWD